MAYCNFITLVLTLSSLLIVIDMHPLNEDIENQKNKIQSLGEKALEKFDQIFYGLVDEATSLITDSKKGDFKDMLIRHRGDLVNNIKENLIHKDNITLSDVKNTITREFSNRIELFNHVGKGFWNKINTLSSKLFNQYKDYCDENPKNIFCLSSNKTNGIEREFSKK